MFADDTQKLTQWRAFLRKTRLTDAPSALPDVIAVISSFLLPIAQAIVNGHEFNQTWKRWAMATMRWIGQIDKAQRKVSVAPICRKARTARRD